MNVATVLRDNGLLRGRAEFVQGGTVVVPVAIRKDVTPSELAQALKETQPDVSSETLMAIGSSPAKLENGRVLLEFVFELGDNGFEFSARVE